MRPCGWRSWRRQRGTRIGQGAAVVAALASACDKPRDLLPDPQKVIPEKVADFPGYTEGIAFDDLGTAYVSAGRNPQSEHWVYRIRPGSAPEAWLRVRVPNGHKVLGDGTHVVAGEGVLLHVSRDGRVIDSLTVDRAGVPLHHPNDIALDGHGGFYMTDPGTGDPDHQDGRVFYVDSAWTVTVAADGFCFPNGLVVRADGRALYLGDGCHGRLYLLAIAGPGRLGQREVLATVPDPADAGLDGMTLDASGRLYVAHYGTGRIEVFDPEGKLMAQYTAGNRLVSNVAFGGPDLGDLYVTGAPIEKSGPGALFRLRLGVRGRASSALPAR